MIYDIEYFDEPSEFERQVDEFKQSLIKAVKTEHLEEMERLRKENAELQSIKSRMEEIETEHKNAICQLKRKEEEAGRKTLDELLDDTKLIMYAARPSYEKKPKCDRCNDNRKIVYKTPLGKTAYEDCECSIENAVFASKEIIRNEFYQRYRGEEIIAWYSFIENNGGHVCLSDFSNSRMIYDDITPYEEMDHYKIMFKTTEKCQKYCDWLNRQSEAQNETNI